MALSVCARAMLMRDLSARQRRCGSVTDNFRVINPKDFRVVT
jgi:hypothetical protein